MKNDIPKEDSALIWSYVNEDNMSFLSNLNNRFINLYPNKILPNGTYKFVLFENDTYKILHQLDYIIGDFEPEPVNEGVAEIKIIGSLVVGSTLTIQIIVNDVDGEWNTFNWWR